MRQKNLFINMEEAEAEIKNRSKKIDSTPVDWPIEVLVNKLQKGDFFVPKYQRNLVWDMERQSRFIESVLMGLPIPPIFLFTGTDGKMEIVDGSQRLRTLREYQEDKFALEGLEVLASLNDTCYSDLLPSRRLKFGARSIRAIILSENADPEARFDMFERINTGSVKANPAEIRRGALPGAFTDLITELAMNSVFKKLAPLSEPEIEKRRHEEFVARFFAYGDGLDKYKDTPSKFVFDYIESLNEEAKTNKKLIKEYKKRFTEVMDFVEKHFPHGFRKNDKAKRTYMTPFEALSVGTYEALKEKPDLKAKPPKKFKWLGSDEFKKLTTSGGANGKKGILDRINYVKQQLLLER